MSSVKETTTTAKPRKRLLRHIHNDTGARLIWMFSKEHSELTTPKQKREATRLLNRLVEEAGIEGSDDLRETYKAAIRALIDKNGRDESETANALQVIAWDFYTALREKQRAASAQREADRATTPACEKCADSQKRAQKTWVLSKSWGKNGDGKTKLQEGDEVTVEKIPVEEIRLGDYLMLETSEAWSPGVLTLLTDKKIRVKSYCGNTYNHDLKEVTIWRLVSIRHTTIIERTADQNDTKSRAENRIKELRAELDDLGDDITDCSQRFRLERQIYDLEREATFDEWPDTITEGGAR